MIEAEWWNYDTADEMAGAVAGDVGFVIERALDARGEALVALPGGRSPAPAFERLAAEEIDWHRVTIIPTDDRLVPVTHPLSNLAMIARRLFAKRGPHPADRGRRNYRPPRGGQGGRCAAR